MDRWTGWTLFSIRGVAVNAHVSLLFLLFYVLLIAPSQFAFVVQTSGVNPALLSGSPFLWGALFAISLVFSILIHEFSHVFVAQAHGAKVHRVTLMMLGGVSEMDKPSTDPRTELKIAIIGPLVSLALAAGLLFMSRTADSANLVLFGYWVGQLNLVLGIFNLIPAFPTDGGRVLRSILVVRQGTLQGTKTAVNVSRVIVWIFGIIGILQFNVILLLVAFFLYAAAKGELFALVAQTVLKDMTADDLRVELPILSEDTTLKEAAEMMEYANSTFLPVEGEFPGILDARSLSRVPKKRWSELTVKSLKVEICNPPKRSDPLSNLVTSNLFSIPGGVPIVENGQIIGVIRQRDVIETIQVKDIARDELPRRRFPTGPRREPEPPEAPLG